jgi:hypothetical protein
LITSTSRKYEDAYEDEGAAIQSPVVEQRSTLKRGKAPPPMPALNAVA